MNLIVDFDYDNFNTIIKELDPYFISEKRNNRMFRYTVIMRDLFQNRITNDDALSQLKQLIDFPKILQSDNISTSEFIILAELTILLPTSEQKLSFSKLNDILQNPDNVISEDNEKLIIMLLVRLTEILVINNDFHNALFYCKIGINLCRRIGSFYSLEYLYYFAALCFHHSSDLKKRNEMIYLTFVAASVDNNIKKN